MRIALYVFIAVTILLASCDGRMQLNKTYYYAEDGLIRDTFKVRSDSAAYMEAYQQFVIAKKVSQDMNESFGRGISSAPVSFTLYNSDMEDITYTTVFNNMASLKQDVEKYFASQSNMVENSKQRAIEQNNGPGAKYDTAGLYASPVKVISAKFIRRSYSSYKDVALRFKNISGKKINAIRFKWYGENAFNEPADMGVVDGWGSGFTDDPLNPGATDYGEWSILSNDGKKIIIAYPYEVAFDDGTKWELGN